MSGLQKRDGQEGGVLINAAHLNAKLAESLFNFEAIFPPLYFQRQVALSDGANDPQPLAAGQVLGKGESLHQRRHYRDECQKERNRCSSQMSSSLDTQKSFISFSVLS